MSLTRRRSAAAERLRHRDILADDVQERPRRHAWFESLFDVEVDLYQQVNQQPHVVENHSKPEVEHAHGSIP